MRPSQLLALALSFIRREPSFPDRFAKNHFGVRLLLADDSHAAQSAQEGRADPARLALIETERLYSRKGSGIAGWGLFIRDLTSTGIIRQ